MTDDDFEPVQPAAPAKAVPADTPLVIDGDWDAVNPGGAPIRQRTILNALEDHFARTHEWYALCAVMQVKRWLRRSLYRGGWDA